jgi:hypothetical protein
LNELLFPNSSISSSQVGQDKRDFLVVVVIGVSIYF